MAATLAQSAALADNATFIARFRAAMVRRLMTLLATPASLTSDQLALARQIAYDPEQYAPVVAEGCVAEAAVIARDGAEATVTDAEIVAAVNAVLPRLVR